MITFDQVGTEGVTLWAKDGTPYFLSIALARPGHRQLRLDDTNMVGYGTLAGYVTRIQGGGYQVTVGTLAAPVVYVGTCAQEGVTALHDYLYPQGLPPSPAPQTSASPEDPRDVPPQRRGRPESP